MSVFPGMIKFRNAANKQLTFRQGQGQAEDITVTLPDALPATPKLWQIEPSGQINLVEASSGGLSPSQLEAINSAIAGKEDKDVAQGLVAAHTSASNPHPQYLTALPSHNHTIANVTGLEVRLQEIEGWQIDRDENDNLAISSDYGFNSGLDGAQTEITLYFWRHLFQVRGKLHASEVIPAFTPSNVSLDFNPGMQRQIWSGRVWSQTRSVWIDAVISFVPESGFPQNTELSIIFFAPILQNEILQLDSFMIFLEPVAD